MITLMNSPCCHDKKVRLWQTWRQCALPWQQRPKAHLFICRINNEAVLSFIKDNSPRSSSQGKLNLNTAGKTQTKLWSASLMQTHKHRDAHTCRHKLTGRAHTQWRKQKPPLMGRWWKLVRPGSLWSQLMGARLFTTFPTTPLGRRPY